ncbi:MAG: BppU family phage baseplate upper protein [Alphaproteobacteria bacterium]|nr:BppU family phage baseplate upper protein [Alphaproteobacteria bacterium]
MTGYVQNNLIAVRQGDSFAINFDLKDKCKPVDLTGATMLMQVRDDSGNLMFSVSGTPVDAVNGKMAILLTPSQTKIDVGDYNTDIQVTLQDGSVNTIFPSNVNQIGVFRVTEQVTK